MPLVNRQVPPPIWITAPGALASTTAWILAASLALSRHATRSAPGVAVAGFTSGLGALVPHSAAIAIAIAAKVVNAVTIHSLASASPLCLPS